MAVKTFTDNTSLPASDINTYLANSGLVYVTEASGTATASISINNCFTSSFASYRLVITETTCSSATQSLFMRLRAGGVDASGANYNVAARGLYTNGGSADTNSTAVNYWGIGYNDTANSYSQASSFDIMHPALARVTYLSGSYMYYASGIGDAIRTMMGTMALANSYDGFTLFYGSGTFTGKVKVYGYRQA